MAKQLTNRIYKLRTYAHCLYYLAASCFIMVVVSLSFREGHLPVVRYLLEDRQCDVNVTDDDGQTSLHIICQ